MDNRWIISILCATLLFVLGQIFIKKSFEKDDNFHYTAIVFGIFIGISAIVYKLLHSGSKFKWGVNKIFYAAIAGIFFFFGNLLWIYSISTNAQLGNIRTTMAGFEMLLLFLVGVVIFNEHIKFVQCLGVALILFGIYIVSSSV